jgi:integrase
MARTRRGAGEGSIFRRKDGRWAAQITLGRSPEGNPVRHFEYGKTRREVAEKLAQRQADRLSGRDIRSGRLTVGNYLRRWLEDIARPRIRSSTHASYTGFLKNHVLPRLGGVQLTKLTALHVANLMADMERDGASAYVREAVYGVLHRALGDAVRLDLVSANPVSRVDRPRLPTKEPSVFTADEVRQLLATAQGDRLEALLVLAVTTGARQGELLALPWRHVHLRDGWLRIEHTLEQVGPCPKRGPTKTPASRRRIDLPPIAIEALHAHRSRLGAIPHPDAFVFTDTQGGPIRKSNLVRRWWRPLVQRAELPPRKFHSLRHTAATLLLAEGTNVKVVQELLGHTRAAITLDVYAHVPQGAQREAVSQLEALLSQEHR